MYTPEWDLLRNARAIARAHQQLSAPLYFRDCADADDHDLLVHAHQRYLCRDSPPFVLEKQFSGSGDIFITHADHTFSLLQELRSCRLPRLAPSVPSFQSTHTARMVSAASPANYNVTLSLSFVLQWLHAHNMHNVLLVDLSCSIVSGTNEKQQTQIRNLLGHP